MIKKLKDFWKRLRCKHQWEVIGENNEVNPITLVISYCEKCGKFKYESFGDMCRRSKRKIKF